MLLPETCSIKIDGRGCELPPSYVVSIEAKEGEYMIAVVCDDHKDGMEHRLGAMQQAGKVPAGKEIYECTSCMTKWSIDQL